MVVIKVDDKTKADQVYTTSLRNRRMNDGMLFCRGQKVYEKQFAMQSSLFIIIWPVERETERKREENFSQSLPRPPSLT